MSNFMMNFTVSILKEFFCRY